MSTYQPIVLVTVSLTATHRIASRDFTDASGNFYKAGLLNFPQIIKQIPQLYYGAEAPQSVTLEIANPVDAGPDNNWYTITNAEEIRGKWVTVGVYDVTDSTTTVYVGKVTSYSLGKTLKITVDMRQDAVLDTLLPQDLVTVDLFTTTAQGVGKPINICFGRCFGVPLPNIQYDTTGNVYDYLIGYGTIDHMSTGYGCKVYRSGVLVYPGEYTFYDGSQASPYPGYAFVRFTAEQVDYNGSPYEMTADVYGLILGNSLPSPPGLSIAMERNFITCLKYLLENTTWGLSDTCDATSFSTAEGIITETYWLCEGAITSQRAARDIINEMLFIARNATLERGTDGEWEITVPTTGSSAATFGQNDGYYDNCEITELSATPVTEAISTVICNYYFDIGGTPRRHLTFDLSQTFGKPKTYDLHFTASGVTAKKVASYFSKRATFDGKITIKAGLEARTLTRGNIFTVIDPNIPALASGKEYIVESINRVVSISGDAGFTINGIEYDSTLYDDETITDPGGFTSGANQVSGPTSLVGGLSLGDGEGLPGTITLNSPAGGGDIFVNAGKTDFTNTDNGFIIGIDDSDLDLPKIYLGNATKYLNWTGAALIIEAGNFSLDASGNITATNATLSGAVTATSGELQTLSITGTITVAAGGVITVASGGYIKVGDASNYVQISDTGILGHSASLGDVFNLPADGSAPTFAAGIIQETEIEMYTSGLIKTNAAPGTNGGLLIDDDHIVGYNSVAKKLLEFRYKGVDEGDAYIGDYDSGNHGLKYDHSAGVLSYIGTIKDRTPWTIKTSSFTAVVNSKYKIDTTVAAITMTLPAAPTDKDYVEWMDQKNNFSTYKLIIARNGKTIMGYSEDMWCTNNGESGKLEYDATTGSWIFP